MRFGRESPDEQLEVERKIDEARLDLDLHRVHRAVADRRIYKQLGHHHSSALAGALGVRSERQLPIEDNRMKVPT